MRSARRLNSAPASRISSGPEGARRTDTSPSPRSTADLASSCTGPTMERPRISAATTPSATQDHGHPCQHSPRSAHSFAQGRFVDDNPYHQRVAVRLDDRSIDNLITTNRRAKCGPARREKDRFPG